MKFVAGLILSVFISLSAVASDSYEIIGADANGLVMALVKAGAYVDESSDSRNLSVSNVSCSVYRDSAKKSSCVATVPTKDGGQSKISISDTKADELGKALITAGLLGCGMQSCFGGATSIDCTYIADQDVPNQGASCFVK
jgi:hypothetical protein